MNWSEQHYGRGNPDCKKCRGIGYYTYDVPHGHTQYGRVHSCECRADNSEEAIRHRCNAAGVTKEGWGLENEFWSLDGREELELATKEMAASFQDGICSGWLTLVAPYGLGKSAMGEWLVIQAIRAGIRAMFMTAEGAQDAIKQSFDGESVAWHKASTSSLLVFDQPDWLYDKGTTYQVNQARNMLDGRYRNRDTRATVLLLNIKGWDNRHESGLSAIFNRAEEGKIVISRAEGVRASIGEKVEAAQ